MIYIFLIGFATGIMSMVTLLFWMVNLDNKEADKYFAEQMDAGDL